MIYAGVFNTKPTPRGTQVSWAFYEGILNSGDCAIWAQPDDALDDFPDAVKSTARGTDVTVQLCEGGNARNILREVANEIGHRRIIMDAAFFNSVRVMDFEDRWEDAYHSVGYDHIKGAADYCNKNSPSDRWEDLNLEMKEWRNSGEHILVLGQNETGFGMNHFSGNKFAAFSDLIFDIRKYTDRPIVFRMHKHKRSEYDLVFKNLEMKNVFASQMSNDNSIFNDLKNAWCSVAITTNAAVDSILYGIPVITADKISAAYEVAEHDISNIENPLMPDRTQWAYDLAYAQWNLEEIREGLPWRHLRSGDDQLRRQHDES